MLKTSLNVNPMLMTKIEQAFAQAVGKWTCCDWCTNIGKTGLNLNGLKASQAHLLARATSGVEKSDWQAAVTWLNQVEQDARTAEGFARTAIELARQGTLKEALFHAQQACKIELKYHHQLVWRPLLDLIACAFGRADAGE